MVEMKGVSFNIPGEQQAKLWIIENIYDRTTHLDSKQCDKSTMPVKRMNCIPGRLLIY